MLNDQPAEIERARALERAKSLATGLLVACLALFVAASWLQPRYPAFGYAAAFAQAAIVGALADWYAVVALFRHPLGLPLPHTAIIPRNQARIAESLAQFIGEHFLVGARVAERVAETDPAGRLADWLAEKANRARLADHAVELLPHLAAALDARSAQALFERGVVERLEQIDLSRLAAGTLDVLTRDGRHRPLFEYLLARIESLLDDPAAVAALRERVRAELPYLLDFFRTDVYLVGRLMDAARALANEMRDDPKHALRLQFDQAVENFVRALRDSPEWRDRLDSAKRDLLAMPELRSVAADAWTGLQGWLRSEGGDQREAMRDALDSLLAQLGRSIRDDTELRVRVGGLVTEVAAGMIERFKPHIARFVADQVKGWDPETLVRVTELNIGKDLQYIRVNGTLIGGGLGVAIHALGQALQ